jgi:hypothetical protein
VALKLHTEYGFDYSNLKVLLGGWNGWKDANTLDPAEYPIDTNSDASANRAWWEDGWAVLPKWLLVRV